MQRGSKKRPYANWPAYQIEKHLIHHQTSLNELRKELRLRRKEMRDFLFVFFGHGTEFRNRRTD